eukprot:CAMPEP_0172300288 /NCGR_PEP_ID=MMETSP1058-20130122/2405_1 /TAXON_ID=83371 /ORGANISM="Detonula confervacea, Strain CCMP 353" /LENGTH=972 /DNA_ID=CAMNT_0013010023 /DNA_START=148 /DNA_END=3066 /DNA_ORIENTATION=+
MGQQQKRNSRPQSRRQHANTGSSFILLLQLLSLANNNCHYAFAFTNPPISAPRLSNSNNNRGRALERSGSRTTTQLCDISYSSSPSSPAPLPTGFTFDDDEEEYANEYNNGEEDPEIDGSVVANGSSGYAPEVNKWTTLMTDGTNAAIHRPGKEMTLEEGIEILYNDLRDLSRHDYEMIESYWDQLRPTVSYLGTVHVGRVHQALRVAYRAHRSQMRKSGEPFIIHPVEVALLLSGMKMDAETVMAGLLHDTVEDTDLTFEQVEAMFGQEVKNIVEGETKVSKLPKLAFAEYADEQAENLRQMFIAMTDDYRIIIVKLADRLHNMRTLRHMKPEKQKKISRETLDIFAPLAHRMGLWPFKSELEDTAFMYLYPHEYNQLNKRLGQRQTQFGETLDNSIEVLEQTLKNDPTLQSQDVEIEVVGRTKEMYSLWHKMEMKHDRNLDHITDLVALRVILKPTNEKDQEADSGVWLCYHVLGLVQHLPGFQPMPTKVKDYISFPKPNGYQSLHTALMYKGQSVEVQIRTSYMHQVAEYGMASHFAYKDEMKRPTNPRGHYNTPWLSSIKEWQQDTVCSRDFVDCVRRELLGKRVFVFLRNGKILNLARGATVVDAAFQIHTEVGLQMHGVEINGKPQPISYKLNNGDVVSILTGEGRPTTEWMRFAQSRSTRSKLRAYFRSKQHDSIRKSGELIFFDYLKQHSDEIRENSYLGYEFEIPTNAEELSHFLPGKTHYNDVEELLFAIGKSHNPNFLRTKLSKIFLVPLKMLEASDESRFAKITQKVYDSQIESNSVSLQDETDEDTQLSNVDLPDGGTVEYADAECACRHCLPINGDTIVGTKGHTIDAPTIVHRLECPYAQQALNDAKAGVNGDEVIGDPVKLVWSDAALEEGNSETFLTEIVIMANDRKLLLADCSVVASKNSEILKTGSSSNAEHCTLEFLVRVSDLQELQILMNKLNEVHSVMSVERRFGSELLE